MTKKVKVTADDVKNIKGDVAIYGSKELIKESLDGGIYEEFGPNKMALILCDWYEVEPEYCVGNWVVVKDEFANVGKISKITKVSDGIALLGGVNNCWWTFRQIRHATPEEISAEKDRRWWKKLNRKVGEWKKGDIFMNMSAGGEVYRPLHEIGEDAIIPGNHLRMVCPAESRLDGDTNENLPN